MSKTKPADLNDAFDSEELIALARIDIDKGRLDEALWKLKQSLRPEKPLPEALAMAARLYAQLGLFDRATALFRRYLEAQPGAVNETFQLGMAHFDAGQVPDAKRIWDDLLKVHPNFPPAMFFRALACVRENEVNDARHRLETILKTIPADNLYFGRAKELLQTIDAGGPVVSGKKETARVTPKDPYKVEH